MRNFFLYDGDGCIVSAGVCSDGDFDLQATPCLTLEEGKANPLTQYFDGVLISIPERPSHHHHFDYASKKWVDPRGMEDLQQSKWREVKAARARAMSEPLTTEHGVFDADPVSRENIHRSTALASNLASLGRRVEIQFTLHDNTVVTLDAPAIAQVAIDLGAREQAIRARATALRERITLAKDAEALSAINW